MRLCCVQCCLHYAPLLSRDLENSFLENNEKRKLKELGEMAINVIQKTLIKQKIREIPIFVNPAENQDPCVKTIMNLDCHLGFMKIQHSCCFMKKMAWKAFTILLFYNGVQSADGFK